jgi:5,10-methylenetetrahydrofolate reductase
MPPRKTFQQAVRVKEFVLTAQLQLQENTGRHGVIKQAQCLSDAVDAITVAANPHGVVHMEGLAAASLLIANDIDPVLHVASRDRNRIALRSQLLGAAAIGVTSLVLSRGDRLAGSIRTETGKESKVGPVKMLRAAKRLSDFQKQHDEPELFLGTLSTVIDQEEHSDWEPNALIAKLDAGAQFIQTKVCLDAERLRRYMATMVDTRLTHRCQIVVSVPVLPSADAARRINEKFKSEVIPGSIMKRLAASNSSEQTGIEIAVEFLRELQSIPGVNGANLSTLGDIEMIPAAISAAGLASDNMAAEYCGK